MPTQILILPQMSFAISKEDREAIDGNKEKEMVGMSEKIREISNKVLLFAAASNSGINTGRTYPAKRAEVFSIHAARGGGKAWWNNPAAHLDDWNWTTLGMYVKAPHKDQVSERMTGTSIAAPVAAGIAALVLEFCRQRLVDGQETIKRPERLITKRGMELLFLQMQKANEPTKKFKTGKYNYLRPWDLLSLDVGEGDAALARKRIATKINQALRELDDVE